MSFDILVKKKNVKLIYFGGGGGDFCEFFTILLKKTLLIVLFLNYVINIENSWGRNISGIFYDSFNENNNTTNRIRRATSRKLSRRIETCENCIIHIYMKYLFNYLWKCSHSKKSEVENWYGKKWMSFDSKEISL